MPVVAPIDIQGAERTIEFGVVGSNFQIPEAIVIGRSFLKDNHVHWDFSQNLLIIPEPNVARKIVLPPRSDCILLVQNDDDLEHDHVTILKQSINDEVILANSISSVKGTKS